MNAIQQRFEIRGEGYGELKKVSSMSLALKIATKWIDEQKTPARILDHMARKGQPKEYSVTRCIGEAHNNPFFDHCNICMPNWEIVVKPIE